METKSVVTKIMYGMIHKIIQFKRMCTGVFGARAGPALRISSSLLCLHSSACHHHPALQQQV